MDVSTEKQRLESIAGKSRYGEGMSFASIGHAFEIFTRFIEPGPILELGPAEGFMTDRLVTLDQPITAVEAGKIFCDAILSRHPQVEVIHCLFEEFEPDRKFQTVILGHVLEHVEDPVELLRRVSQWIEPGGRILAAVPNSRSIHRQAAVIMGILEFEEELNDLDRHHGHRRVYNPETFRNDFIRAGLTIEVFGGYWLKPLSNQQLESLFTPLMADAFMRLGERYPDISGEIYVVATKPNVAANE